MAMPKSDPLLYFWVNLQSSCLWAAVYVRVPHSSSERSNDDINWVCVPGTLWGDDVSPLLDGWDSWNIEGLNTDIKKKYTSVVGLLASVWSCWGTTGHCLPVRSEGTWLSGSADHEEQNQSQSQWNSRFLSSGHSPPLVTSSNFATPSCVL